MDIISTSDLRSKEIINTCNGASLGFACDFEFNKCTGQVTGLVLEETNGFLGLGRKETLIIPWCKIQCIGEDTILVSYSECELKSFTRKKNKRIF